MNANRQESGKTAISFSNPNVPRLGEYIASAARRGLPVVTQDMHAEAPGALICALGNSLKDPVVIESIRSYADQGYLVFSMKEGITFLAEELGVKVHYSVAMDPGADRQIVKTPIRSDITYCVASSCNIAYFDYLLENNCRVMVFHSACGWPNEMLMYRHLFGRGDTMIGGFTVTNRTIALTKFMGIKKCVIAGADFGWRDDKEYYAPGIAAKPLTDVVMHDHGDVDGRSWHSRPDLVASAVSVARLIKEGQVEVIGDSLAASMSKRSLEYLDKVAMIRKPGGATQIV